jgi:hypothetical protein
LSAALYALDMKIGIDIGNVIIQGGGTDTQFFTDDYLMTPEMVGAWNAIATLHHDHELHIISKCGPVVEEKSLRWLRAHGFTKLLKTHRIHFVRKRPLKAPMAQALELDIFIDDMEDVIESMEGIVKHRILHTSWQQTNAELERIMDEQA